MSFYLVPIAGSGARQDPMVPKYVPALGVGWAMIQFGATAIVWADATAAMDASVGANADAIVVPPPDNTIGAGALTAVQNEVETLNLPAQWVTVGMTYRSVLRVLAGMAQLIQRTSGILGFTPVIAGNLNKTISQFPANVQSALASAVDSLGLDRSQIIGSTTLRAALLNIGQQFIAGTAIALGDL